MTWLGSSRPSREQGSMCIFALDLIFVLNGTLGKHKKSKKKKEKKRNHFEVFILVGSYYWSWCFCDTLLRGFPVWLKYVPGISFRTDNGPFKVCLCSCFVFFFSKFSINLFWTLIFTMVMWFFFLHVATVSHAEVYTEDCSDDERWKVVPVSRWSHYSLSGISYMVLSYQN